MPDWNEATTRKTLIDPALRQAGWDLDDPDQVRFEIPVDGTSPETWQAQQALLQNVAREAGVPYEVNLPSGMPSIARTAKPWRSSRPSARGSPPALHSLRPSSTCARWRNGSVRRSGRRSRCLRRCWRGVSGGSGQRMSNGQADEEPPGVRCALGRDGLKDGQRMKRSGRSEWEPSDYPLYIRCPTSVSAPTSIGGTRSNSTRGVTMNNLATILEGTGPIFVICGAFTTLFLALFGWQERHTERRFKEMAERVDRQDAKLAGAPAETKMRISIVQPTDWHWAEPKKARDKPFVLPVPVSGLAFGPIGSAYLAYKTPSSAGEYRVVAKLAINEGAWKAELTIPGWDNSPAFEAVAIAYPAKLDLRLEMRVDVSEAVLSKPVKIKIELQ